MSHFEFCYKVIKLGNIQYKNYFDLQTVHMEDMMGQVL